MTTAPAPNCPKCGQSSAATAESCARCGLVFARWIPSSGQSESAPAFDDATLALWAEVQAAWSDLAKHEAFLKHCNAAGLLEPAGRLYRRYLDDHPADEVGKRMQARLCAMAIVPFGAPRTHQSMPITRSAVFWLTLGVSAVLGVAAALTWW